jgi:hypothetical protein
VKIGGLMPTKKRVVPEFQISDFDKYMQAELAKGKTKEQVLSETFNNDGFIIFSETMEERVPKLESAQLFAPTKTASDIEECRRLREQFGPISDCVDYIKNQILAGGFDVFIDDPNDKHKQEIKKELLSFIKNIYQDFYTSTLNGILDIMLDEAIITGFSAAEIVYEENPTFDKYAKSEVVPIEVKDEKGRLTKSNSVIYKLETPTWTELKGIKRLKVIDAAYRRLKLYRQTDWEANYWTLDEVNAQAQMATPQQQLTEKLMGKLPNQTAVIKAVYYHPWQIFALSINRQRWDYQGRSLILPILSVVKLLEKIMNAVGEGIYRAGNKKYFIVCGTEKRPWSVIHIRNLLQQLKEAGEKGWSTIPVPAGFDIKEAGGEVFEAQNVIDYFLRIISSSMHVPPKIVGLESRDILPEQMTDDMLRYKEAFRTAIETQLFKLVIWTEFGNEKSKQGGSKDPQYIPEVRFKTEELMSDVNRLKMCKEILNVANPVRPETKLEVEREINKIMGFDVLLPSQEEYKKEMEKLDEEMKKKLAEKPQQPEGTEGEKFQGPPKPQTEEQQQKRLQAGVNVRKAGSKKGKIPSKEESMAIEESQVVIEEPEPQEVHVTVETKTEPQKIVIENPPVDSAIKEILRQILENSIANQELLNKKQTELIEKQKILEEEESKKKQAKIQAEIDKLKNEIDVIKANKEKIELEKDELKRIAEDKQKTEEEKRKVISKIEKELEGK